MSNEENVYNNFEEYKKMLEMKNSPKIKNSEWNPLEDLKSQVQDQEFKPWSNHKN